MPQPPDAANFRDVSSLLVTTAKRSLIWLEHASRHMATTVIPVSGPNLNMTTDVTAYKATALLFGGASFGTATPPPTDLPATEMEASNLFSIRTCVIADFRLEHVTTLVCSGQKHLLQAAVETGSAWPPRSVNDAPRNRIEPPALLLLEKLCVRTSSPSTPVSPCDSRSSVLVHCLVLSNYTCRRLASSNACCS